jgi:thymidine phosphorylase
MNTKNRTTPSSELIRKKAKGETLDEVEIYRIIEDILNGNLNDAQIAYFVSVQKLIGMNYDEIYYLTNAMIGTGNEMVFGDRIISDKHCVGGVAGNRTTPIVVSICVALGLTVPKTSSRAITSAAGTADTIETLANVELGMSRIKQIVKKEGGCMIWNAKAKLSPTDDKIIKIEKSLGIDISSQLVASVLSKKISMGSHNLIIDIPYGPGSKIGDLRNAKKLRSIFKNVGKRFGLNIKVIFSDGKNPVGNGIGPILEMKDVISVLKNEPDAPGDLKEKSILLAAELLKLNNVRFPKRKARKALKSGIAYEKFRKIINAQNGRRDFEKRATHLAPAKFSKDIFMGPGGYIKRIDNEGINSMCRILGCPEGSGSGVFLYKKNGRIKKNSKLLTLYSDDKKKLNDAIEYFWETGVVKFK